MINKDCKDLESPFKSFSSNFCFKLHSLMFAMDKIADVLLRKELNITYSKFLVLMSVGYCPNKSQKCIADHLDHTEAAVSRQVSNLEKDGLVKIKLNNDNKREKLVDITKKGEGLLEKSFEILSKATDNLLSTLSKKEVDIMDKSLDKLIFHVHQEMETYFSK